jgi:hypothetical protein
MLVALHVESAGKPIARKDKDKEEGWKTGGVYGRISRL